MRWTVRYRLSAKGPDRTAIVDATTAPDAETIVLLRVSDAHPDAVIVDSTPGPDHAAPGYGR